MSGDALAVHRSFYEAIETGDVDLMAALWWEGSDTSCTFPGSEPVRGTGSILRSWTLLMASADYLQFFLTDVQIAYVADGAVAIISCTENILSGRGLDSPERFGGARATATSVLVLRRGHWLLHTHHAAPLFGDEVEDVSKEWD